MSHSFMFAAKESPHEITVKYTYILLSMKGIYSYSYRQLPRLPKKVAATTDLQLLLHTVYLLPERVEARGGSSTTDHSTTPREEHHGSFHLTSTSQHRHTPRIRSFTFPRATVSPQWLVDCIQYMIRTLLQ
jgi:hypothetical protein